MLSSSSLCQPDTWLTDIDEMAVMYDNELNNLLDQLILLGRLVVDNAVLTRSLTQSAAQPSA